MRFVVVRHGQSTNNLLWEQTGSEQGRHPDTPLTGTGLAQAARLGEAVAGGVLPWPVDALYCSLMMRAVQTAAPLAEALDLPLLGHPDIHEVGGPYDMDAATGTMAPYRGAGAADLRAVSARLVLPADAGVDGWYRGELEPVDSAAARAASVVEGLRAAHGEDETVVLVSHGYFSQFLFRHFLQIERMTGWLEIHNTSVSLYEDVPDRPGMRAVRVNWLPHLPDDLVTY
ncbi:MAG: histidine phosphatase family protein [Propionicimonas sp.]|uniref:histidine phosphatase family protein n=1 Tax=Propionicimonas sp. TaxID=1955623 RepID=UPI003D0BCD7C